MPARTSFSRALCLPARSHEVEGQWEKTSDDGDTQLHDAPLLTLLLILVLPSPDPAFNPRSPPLPLMLGAGAEGGPSEGPPEAVH
jgi:hypothetical protein